MANSSSGGNCYTQGGTITSQGYNLSDDASCAASFNQTGDMNSTAAGLDPSGLQNNGGPTQTIALLSTSKAVDAIPLSPINYCTDTSGNAITTDQRGVPRPQGSACDIGAFELSQGQTSQTITFTTAAPGTASYNSTFTVAAKSDSGLAVTLSVDSGSTSVCSLGTPSVSGGVTSAMVTMLKSTGTCAIDAYQFGNANYNPAVPQQTSATAVIASQTITFTTAAPGTATYGSMFTVAAQSTSGLTVALSVDGASTGVCSLGSSSTSGAMTSATATMASSPGTCTIDANQLGNSNYTAAAQQQTSAMAVPATYSIGGAVTGFAGTGLVLQVNGGNNLPVSANGTFTFTTSIAGGGTYAVTVLTQPSGPTQTCVVSSGSGTVASANVTNVAVACTTIVGSSKVTFNNTNAAAVSFGSGTFSKPMSVTGGGTNTVAFAMVMVDEGSGTPGTTFTVTASYGGQAMTSAGPASYDYDYSPISTRVFYLLNPPTGSNTLVITATP